VAFQYKLNKSHRPSVTVLQILMSASES